MRQRVVGGARRSPRGGVGGALSGGVASAGNGPLVSVYLVKEPAIMNNPRSEPQSPRRDAAFRGTFLKAEALFLASLPVIDAAVSQVCRRHYLQAAEADEFASEVRLHFIEKHYEPLRQFRGQASLRTYLGVVVNHLFLDYRNRLWGKWRPSADAKRQGLLAILVERFVTRDGWTLEQAIEMVRVNHRV